MQASLFRTVFQTFFQYPRINIPLHGELLTKSKVLNTSENMTGIQLQALKLCNPAFSINQTLSKNIKVMLIGHSLDEKWLYIGTASPKQEKRNDMKRSEEDSNLYEFFKCEASDKMLLTDKTNFDKSVDNYVKYIKAGILQSNIFDDTRGADNKKQVIAGDSSLRGTPSKKKPEKVEIPNGSDAITHLVVCSDDKFNFQVLQAAIKKVLPGVESISRDFSTLNPLL
jgi:hypothetical protein